MRLSSSMWISEKQQIIFCVSLKSYMELPCTEQLSVIYLKLESEWVSFGSGGGRGSTVFRSIMGRDSQVLWVAPPFLRWSSLPMQPGKPEQVGQAIVVRSGRAGLGRWQEWKWIKVLSILFVVSLYLGFYLRYCPLLCCLDEALWDLI